jgi:hypothetical protein
MLGFRNAKQLPAPFIVTSTVGKYIFEALEIFQDPRANARIYQYVPSEIDPKICEPLNLGRILTYIARKEQGVNANH